jgi:hypothetical protein
MRICFANDTNLIFGRPVESVHDKLLHETCKKTGRGRSKRVLTTFYGVALLASGDTDTFCLRPNQDCLQTSGHMEHFDSILVVWFWSCC